jgi:Bacterial protein of unknown function (DUF853)
MAKRKAVPTEGDSSGGVTETAPADSIYLGKSTKLEFIYLRLANRHGLITGATNTGKAVTLQGLAEGFSGRRDEFPQRWILEHARQAEHSLSGSGGNQDARDLDQARHASRHKAWRRRDARLRSKGHSL